MDDQFYVSDIFPIILQAEQKELVTRTFRRLDPQQQQTILKAILEEAGEKGPQDLNIKKVAERAGVSVGSLYQYFGNRQKLLAFAIELVVRVTVDTFNSYRPYMLEMSLQEALGAYLTGGIEWSRQQAGFARFFGAAAYHGDRQMGEKVVQPIADVLQAMLRDVFQAAARRGELREDIDLEASVRLLNVLLIAMGDAQLLPELNTYYRLFDETVSPDRLMAVFLELVQKGIGINPDERPIASKTSAL